MIKKILYMPLILYFLPAFVVPYFAESHVTFLVLFIPIFLGLLFTLKFKTSYLHILDAIKRTPLKYFIIFYVGLFAISLFSVILGRYSIIKLLYTIFYSILFNVFFLYIYPIMIIPKYINLRNFIKFLYIMYSFIFIWGFLEFCGATLHVTIINNLVSFLSNIRSEDISIVVDSHSGLARIRSVFMEPGTYARFLTINLPIIYAFSTYKGKIFNNLFLNKIIKPFLLISFGVSIILIQSPINFVFVLIIFFFLLYKKILKFIVKHFVQLTICVIVLSVLGYIAVSNIDVEQTFLVRILNVTQTFAKLSLHTLLEVEPSLGTRIVFYVIQLGIWLHYPLIGLGIGNNGPLFVSYFSQTKLPMTYETLIDIATSTDTLRVQSTLGIFLLTFSGIIGFYLYVLFMQKIIFGLKKCINTFCGIEYVFVKSLHQSIIIMFILSLIYGQGFYDQQFWFLCGVATSVHYYKSMLERKV